MNVVEPVTVPVHSKNGKKPDLTGLLNTSDVVHSRNEDALFRELINDYEECGMARRVRKVFYEIHGDGVPRPLGHWELLQKSVRFVTWGLGSFASGARVTELLDKSTKIRPNVVATYCFKGFVLPDISCKDMIMFVLKDFESEVRNVRYENPIIEPK